MPRIPERFIIPAKNTYKTYWDILILSLAVYNGLMVPFDMSFGVILSARPLFQAFDIMIDICFIIDILLMFITSATNKQGIESKDSVEISNLYTSTIRFKTDILSIFGSDFFVSLWEPF